MADYKEYGETFCVLPWLQAMTRNHGTMMPCCISDNEIKRESGVPYYLWESTIGEVRNSAHFRDIRWLDRLSGGKGVPPRSETSGSGSPIGIMACCRFHSNYRESIFSSRRRGSRDTLIVSSDRIQERLRRLSTKMRPIPIAARLAGSGTNR